METIRILVRRFHILFAVVDYERIAPTATLFVFDDPNHLNGAVLLKLSSEVRFGGTFRKFGYEECFVGVPNRFRVILGLVVIFGSYKRSLSFLLHLLPGYLSLRFLYISKGLLWGLSFLFSLPAGDDIILVLFLDFG